jgi:hypothetical protein
MPAGSTRALPVRTVLRGVRARPSVVRDRRYGVRRRLRERWSSSSGGRSRFIERCSGPFGVRARPSRVSGRSFRDRARFFGMRARSCGHRLRFFGARTRLLGVRTSLFLGRVPLFDGCVRAGTVRPRIFAVRGRSFGVLRRPCGVRLRSRAPQLRSRAPGASLATLVLRSVAPSAGARATRRHPDSSMRNLRTSMRPQNAVMCVTLSASARSLRAPLRVSCRSVYTRYMSLSGR